MKIGYVRYEDISFRLSFEKAEAFLGNCWNLFIPIRIKFSCVINHYCYFYSISLWNLRVKDYSVKKHRTKHKKNIPIPTLSV